MHAGVPAFLRVLLRVLPPITFLIFVSATPALAQVAAGEITGIVTDQAGAALACATVTVPASTPTASASCRPAATASTPCPAWRRPLSPRGGPARVPQGATGWHRLVDR